jgi:type VI secretion system protein ImpC
MVPLTTPPPARLGDCLRALASLRPRDYWAGAAITQLLGQKRRGLTAVSQTGGSADLPSNDEDDEEEKPQANQPMPRLRLVTSDDQAPPARDAVLEQVSQTREAAPAWLADVAPLMVPVRIANPFGVERESLFEPKLQRAIVTRLAATWQSSGELDLAVVVRLIASSQPLRVVPRRRVATTRKGVRLLVDQSEAMQPFQQDVAELVRAFRRTVGSSRLRVEGFVGLPSRDVCLGLEWRAYRPDSLGMSTVLISDLGLPPQTLMGLRTEIEDWRRFFAWELRAGNSPIVVVPRNMGSLPGDLRRQVRLVPWDRRSSVRRLVASSYAADASSGHGWSSTAAVGLAALNPLATLDGQTLRLATACALAVRVEPPLLRALRLQLLPDGGVELEARMWFSTVVSDRASTGLVLDSQARELLLRRLRSDQELLAQSWKLVSQAHADAAPALRAEEQACYHWLCGDEAAARAVLRSMVATVVDPGRRGAWRWASQAVARLPRALLGVEEAQMFAMGVALRTGESQLLHDLDSRGGAAWHWLRPAGRDIELAVILREGMIEFTPSTSRLTLRLRVPDLASVMIEIRPLDLQAAASPVRINPRQRTLVPMEGEDFELQVIGGECYRLRAQLQARTASTSSQKFIARNRAPRVQIEYALELYGAEKKVQLPFVMGVLADLSGKPAEPLPPVADRKFLDVDIDNFDARMKALQPRVVLQVADLLTGQGQLAVDLTFERMDDFSPGAVARRIKPLANLLEERGHLANLLTFMDSKGGAEELVAKVLDDPSLLKNLAVSAVSVGYGASALSTVVTDGGDLMSMLHREFKPRTDAERNAVEQALQALVRQTIASAPSQERDVFRRIQMMIDALDGKLSAQLNAIFHQEDFQKLESAWRGLHYLVNNTETDEMLKIRVMNISKQELHRTLKRYKGTSWDQSPIFKKVYEEEYGQLWGEPFGCLVGDYYFDHTPPDVELLGEMAKVASSAHAPFIAAAGPTLMQMESWQELANPRDLIKIFTTPPYAAWRSLRESDNARYIGLTMPRFLARQPYGAKTNPVEDFNFEENTAGTGHSKYTWANSAYLMATNINRSFKCYGWCASIRGVEGGGIVEGLPTHTGPTDDDDVDMKCPTEIAISDRREAELAKNGVMPLIHRKNSDEAAFIGAHSLHKPAEYDDAVATVNAYLAALLPYLFAACRFVHYLKCIVRDKVGSFKERDDMAKFLNSWIMNYIDGDPANSSETVKAYHPLAAAWVELDETDENLGHYLAKIDLLPHYQLEGLTVSLRMVTKIPSSKL